MSDRVLVRDLQLVARHGVLPEEAVLGQRFVLDITAHLDLLAAGTSDDLAASVSYADLITVASERFTGERFALIETAAETVAAALLARFPQIEQVDVEVRKPAAPIDAVFGYVAVAIERRRTRA